MRNVTKEKEILMKMEVLMAVKMLVVVLYAVKPCGLVGYALQMGAGCSFITSIPI